MNFREQLNEYMTVLGCTAKDICAKSGISASTFSRYRSGERLPERKSETFENLCAAIAEIAAEKNIPDTDRSAVREAFLSSEDLPLYAPDSLVKNFNTLISTLNISIAKLCPSINYDASTVFRFRNGTRRPADPERFASAVAGYVVRNCTSAKDTAVLSELTECTEEELSDSALCYKKLTEWLLSAKKAETTSVSDFLTKLDGFDLNEYIKSVRFDELKVPTVPFQIPSSKAYFGLKDMMESELDFLKATVLSRSSEPVIMYSDMPLGEMAKDPDFPKKWMFGMAMMLKKGLHLHQIHDINRSFDEMMLGLESWIPMYMTGQISPYYIKNPQNDMFLHLLKVSGAAALSGEAITGYHEDGRYYLTKSKKELEYYSKRAKEMLSNASVLMNIYRSENANELKAFLIADAEKPGKRRSIMPTPPLYTMDESLLTSMLIKNGFTAAEISEITESVAARRRRIEKILETDIVEDEISELSEKEFSPQSPTLDLSAAFCEKDVFYGYGEYLEHLKDTEKFAETHPNYTLKKTASHAFGNLNILIHEGKWAMVSKGKAPAIHFVIHHPKLRDAIENFVPPLVEDGEK